MRVKFIYNPAAGRGRASRHHAEAERHLRALGADVDAYATSSPADLTRAAAEASRGEYDRVVVSGGDGTLHLAVREQLSVDRPPGIRDLKRQLQTRYADEHRAEHALMEALGEELWVAQRDGRAPDERQYLLLARNRLATL